MKWHLNQIVEASEDSGKLKQLKDKIHRFCSLLAKISHD